MRPPTDPPTPSRPQAEAAERFYGDLRAIAGAYLREQRPGHTLQPTALVHEAFLKLQSADPSAAEDRSHFLALAATAMRQILVNHARARATLKRGGGDADRLRLDASDLTASGPGPGQLEILALHDALERLAQADPRKARLVELRFFGGLTSADAAAVLGISLSTAEADWRFARAWLLARLTEQQP